MLYIDRRLADIASKQRMLLTIADVIAAGGGHDHARRRVDSGRWIRVARGVYLIAGAPFDWPTRQLAAVFAAGPGAVTSHFAAARLWALPGYGTAGVELTIPRHRHHRCPDVRVHESTDLDRCRVVQLDAVPVTDADRTLLDVARFVGHQRLTRSVEAARRAEHVTWSSLISMLAGHARQGRPGVRRLRGVILEHAHRAEITDTDMELLVLGLITGAGLPEPTLHHKVFDGGRFVAEVDLGYPQWKIAIECDGSVHLDPAVRERDLARQNDLVLAGWTILRFSYDRVRTRPDLVIAEIRAAIAAARA
jgi:predicted transcriptional regulator of viral defense system